MRLYIHYEQGDEDLHMTIKLKLPKKWKAGPVLNLKQTFVEAYNKKHPDNALELEAVHVATAKGKALADDAVVETNIEDREDIHVKKGAAPSSSSAAGGKEEEPEVPSDPSKMTPAQAKAAGLVRCRNYGCNGWFKEEDNPEGGCKHHVKPPIFHETRKGWSCCKDRPGGLVYSWEEFMKLEGCASGKHSTVPPEETFAVSPTLAMAEKAAGEARIKSAADFEAEHPEPTPSESKRAVKPRPKPRADGKARCVNGGCQQEYVVADNADSACSYHKGQAVFHDRGKYWSCCADKKTWTWEDFMAVPGCATGPHRDWIPPEE